MAEWYERTESARAKRRALRDGMDGDGALAVIGAHDAMGAHLAEVAGFDAIWVSGFGVSAMAHALPDVNLTTLTEVRAAAERIDRATDLPVIVDCDNGFGGALNVRRTVAEFERAGVAAVCIEDNLFPKRNSLLGAEVKRDLVPIREQAARLALAKQAQLEDDFVVVARLESLIAGHGVDDALERAAAYVDSGVDALLVHSRDKTLREVDEFLDRWDGSVPLVAVPTLFPSFTVEDLAEKGFRVVIFANQLMRAAVGAMEECLEELAGARRAEVVDPSIVSVGHIFDLVGTRRSIEMDVEASG